MKNQDLTKRTMIGIVSIAVAFPSVAADETVTGKLTVDQNASTTALEVTGGGGGSNMAIFRRDIGADGEVRINAAGANPQIVFDDLVPASNDGLWAIGLSAGTDSFRIVNDGSIYGATNEFFTIENNGNVGIGTTSPGSKLAVVGSGGTTVDFYVNGRMRSDNNDGGLWVQANRFFGGHGTNKMGLWSNGSWRLTVDSSGNMGVGTTSPTHLLTVNGTIKAEEVIVEAGIAANDITIRPKAWADDVFSPDYKLSSLNSLEEQISVSGHLPGVPSKADVAANGVSVAEMQAILLRKVEELTLHLIAHDRA